MSIKNFYEILKTSEFKDIEVADIINDELTRQRSTLCLIPSENYISREVAIALSSPLNNKYSEGYPHKWKENTVISQNGKYYQGQKNAIAIEELAMKRGLELFTQNPDLYHINVQSLSGAPANLAVLNAFLNKGDTFMGLALDFGGHLTHGHKVNITSKYYNAVQYSLNNNGELDFDEIEKLALLHKPKLIFCGATAYPLKIDFSKFSEIAKKVGAILAADISHICGLCIANEHPHPFPYADVITTTTHKILRGPRAGIIISKKEYGQQIDKSIFPGIQGGPHMSAIAAMAVAFKEAMQPEYRDYIKQVIKNAKVLSEELQKLGFNIVSKRTENHLILLDVVNNGHLSVENGSWLAERLELAGIITNKNTIPGDKKPWIPSGIRIGTPAATTLGMKEDEMKLIANLIKKATENSHSDDTLKNISLEIKTLLNLFIEKNNNLLI
ncbi:MAG: serine hydroxymethyltransferase [Endomicrobium sp.]|jgi:glycine hydroxymethyltransferase|nr:serine hydroxymethyltransferase [Endomicrobium sp.]